MPDKVEEEDFQAVDVGRVGFVGVGRVLPGPDHEPEQRRRAGQDAQGEEAGCDGFEAEAGFVDGHCVRGGVFYVFILR